MPVTYYENYSPVGDVLVLAISIVFFILIRAAYINKQKNYAIFLRILILLPVAAVCNILFHIFMNNIGEVENSLIYLTRMGYHMSLFGMLVLYISYVVETVKFTDGTGKKYMHAAYVGFAAVVLYEFTGIIFRFGFYIDDLGQVHGGFPFFAIGYVYFIAIAVWALYKGSESIYKQIIRGVLGCTLVSFVVMFLQGVHGQRSFTTASFTFPVFALLYLVHANPYDLTIGTIGADSFRDLIHYSYERKRSLYIMSLYLPDFDRPGSKYPDYIQSNIRSVSNKFFKGATLFEVGDGHLILTIDIVRNPDYAQSGQKMIESFLEKYEQYHYDYKITKVKTVDDGDKLDYLNLIQYVQNRTPSNCVREIGEKEIESFREHKYIVQQLADINAKRDPDDPRVLAFCQPVLNTFNNCYDTAEALMRLKLPEIGMVFPDRFIPIAEKYNYIQGLSEIVLAKACKEIRLLLDQGYHITRISVNMSAFDIRRPDFSEMVKNTIYRVGIPAELIAIEITESQSESEFKLVGDKIYELQQCGIKFYLDDFGTGYSNFERIMELPFDIIKFDRSLTVSSGTSIKSETIVSYLAHMFSDMGYAVLYEGVEDETDEDRCMRMCARYLQGYKYSKPIPIEDLADYFLKEDEYQEKSAQTLPAEIMASQEVVDGAS